MFNKVKQIYSTLYIIIIKTRILKSLKIKGIIYMCYANRVIGLIQIYIYNYIE